MNVRINEVGRKPPPHSLEHRQLTNEIVSWYYGCESFVEEIDHQVYRISQMDKHSVKTTTIGQKERDLILYQYNFYHS
jgi:hypothetical protein